MFKIYHEQATWWPLLSALEDYADEAEFFGKILSKANLPASPSFLELGCSGGSHAFYLKKIFDKVILTDLSPHMLEISRSLNPDCEHLEGDMKKLRLEQEFDTVFIHDAIDYMLTLKDLEKAMKTAFIHCKAGGVALLVPDHVRENFEVSSEQGGQDGEGRALRYMEWSYDPNENDTKYIVEYVYVLREDNKPTRVEQEQHICGIFPRTEWLRLLFQIGFETIIVHDQYERDIFVARKPK